MLEIIQIPVLSDNYIYLLHEPFSQQTAVVDPALAEPVLIALDEMGWSLNTILTRTITVIMSVAIGSYSSRPVVRLSARRVIERESLGLK